MIIDPNDLSEFDDTPDESLLGLSYRDLLALQIFPFAQTSTLKIRKHIPVEVLDKLPFFRLCENVLAIVTYAARQVCTLAGLIKKRNNALSLTKKGQKLRTDRSALFAKVLYAHVWDFDTWQFDRYPDRALVIFLMNPCPDFDP